mmetsp:Transcript_39001/g.99740  ORF Transcript_39001/g.99740 Transcript_39001/m.99740 type:complete len:223 (-) Transcript_39001:27-695(-)|eukprot:jgi/Tetstr1/444787/TSEL_032635.t1
MAAAMASNAALAAAAAPSARGSSALPSRSSAFVGSRVTLSKPQPAGPSSRGALQVVAGKGKGKQLYRARPGGGGPQRELPPTPPVDPDNVEFVLFVRSKKTPQWMPLSVVKGGTSANMLVKSMEGNFAKDTFRDTLIRNIGEVIYKDNAEIEAGLKQAFPPMKWVTEFEYGFKIRDKAKPDNWYIAENSKIMIIPPKDKLPKPPAEDLKEKAGNFLKGLGGK